MPVFSVIDDLCRQDGICASVCPVHAIKGSEGVTPVMAPGAENSCIACGHCMAFCPHGAARVDTLPPGDMHPVDFARLPDAAAVARLLKTRRSIRRFKKEAAPRELLEKILDAARHAPSAKNRQPVRWVVIYNRETLRAVGDEAAAWLAAPETARLIPEGRALHKAWMSGLDPLFRGAPHLVLAVTDKSWPWGMTDAAIALTYLELAALPHGVGACWGGYITTAARSHPPLQKLLGIGEEEQVQGGQMLGFIGLRPTATAPRNPLPSVWL